VGWAAPATPRCVVDVFARSLGVAVVPAEMHQPASGVVPWLAVRTLPYHDVARLPAFPPSRSGSVLGQPARALGFQHRRHGTSFPASKLSEISIGGLSVE
jgi:hypothetical protein